MSLTPLQPKMVLNGFKQEQKFSCDFTTVMVTLASLDVDKLAGEQLRNVARCWCRAASLLHIFAVIQGNKRGAVTAVSIARAHCWAETAIQLHLKLKQQNMPDLDPLISFLGCSDDIFNDEELEYDFPRKALPDVNGDDPRIQFFARIRELTAVTATVSEICRNALTISLFHHKFPIDSDIFEFVTPIQTLFGCLTSEEIQAGKSSPDRKLPEGIEPKSYGIENEAVQNIAAYFVCATAVFGLEFPRGPKTDPREFTECVPDWMRATESIQCDLTTDTNKFVALCAYEQLKRDPHVFENVPETANPLAVSLYALYINVKTPFLDTFFAMTFPEQLRKEIDLFRAAWNTPEAIDKLVANPKDLKSAIALLVRHPLCLPRLNMSERLHRLVALALASSIDLEKDVDVSEFGVMAFCRALELHMVPSVEFVKGLLGKILDKLKEMTKPEETDLVFAGIAPPSAGDQAAAEASKVVSFNCRDLLSENEQPWNLVCLFLTVLCLEALVTVTDESIIELVAEISLSWYLSSPRKHRALNLLLKVVMPSSFFSLQKEKCMMHLHRALAQSELRGKILKSLSGVLSQDLTFACNLTSAFLAEKDDAAIVELVSACWMKQGVSIEVLPPDSRLAVMVVLVRREVKDASSVIHAILQSLPGQGYKVLGSIANERAAFVLSILERAAKVPTNMEAFLEGVVPFSGPVSPQFLAILRLALSVFPVVGAPRDTSPSVMQKIPLVWSDEHVPVQEVQDQPVGRDIWEFKRTASKCECGNDETHMFFCYTCRIWDDERICLSCAQLCHFGHDLVYVGTRKSRCACKNCKARTDQLPPLPVPRKSASNQPESTVTVSSSLLMTLFKSLSSCSIASPTVAAKTNRLSCKVRDWELHEMPSRMVDSELKAVVDHESPTIVNVPKVAECIMRQHGTHLIRRASVNVMSLCCVVREGAVLVVCEGETLKAYDTNTYQLLSSCSVNRQAMQLATCPVDSSIFAFAGLHEVILFRFDDSGFENFQTIELMLEDISPNLFVNQIMWVPQSPLYLAVVCNDFVKIYDVVNDVFSPMCCFTLDGDHFTSIVMAMSGDECYAILGLASGRIAKQSTNVEGPVSITTFIDITTNGRSMSVVSMCEKSDLLFISSLNEEMILCRLSEVLTSNNTPKKAVVTFPKAGIVSFTFSHGPLHYFTAPATGSVLCLEIANDCFEISTLTKAAGPGQLLLIDGRSTTISSFVLNKKLHLISGTAGKLMALVSAVDVVDEPNQDEEDEQKSVLGDEEPLPVPASFWTESRIEQSDIQIETCREEGSRNVCFLMSGSRYVFNNRTPHKVLKIWSVDDAKVIVGVRVNVGSNAPYHRPPWIKINGRKYPVSEQRGFMLPLKKNELGRPFFVELGSNNGYDINCDAVTVFVVDRNSLPWMCREEDSEVEVRTKRDVPKQRLGAIRRLQSLCSRVFPVTDVSVDEETVRFVVNSMYTEPEACAAARLILLKSVGSLEHGSEVWANECEKVIAAKQVSKDTWPLVWDDVFAFPEAAQARLVQQIWESSPELCGTPSVVCAFLAK